MSLEVGEVARILTVLAIFLSAAHLGAALFVKLRQPPVIGEIAGGLLLGPSVLALVAPSVSGWLAPTGTPTGHMLGVVYQLGTILMVFLAGLEMRPGDEGAARRTVAYTSVLGLVIPFAGGLAIAQVIDPGALAGPHGSAATISLVLGLAIAVTSIPVISRIMMDLGIMDTLFARTVLTVAVIEDILLYVVLAVILGLANVQADSTHGLPALIGAEGIGWYVAYYVAASVLFFAVFLAAGRALFRWLSHHLLGVLERRSPVALRLLFLFALCLCCMGLGIDPIFGALLAGIAMAEARTESMDVPTGVAAGPSAASPGLGPLRGFSLAFFVPIYFALVGFRLDVVHNLDLVFFAWLFVVACLVKFGGVWAGARLAGNSPAWSTDFAVAMNARGGPGIVLASVTFAAGVINATFFVAMVLLSIFTSQLAGVWLRRTQARDNTFTSPEPGVPQVSEGVVQGEAVPETVR
ncbi:cation:proton antiporter [Spirillospora sp. NPDC048819]|uniref:cation:proton antiporter n=1 Tax=Spirillospora sp. NPDC048819 TaxID=3155268 RepID=UPI0033FDAF14